MLKQTFLLQKALFRGQYTLFIYTRRHKKAPVQQNPEPPKKFGKNLRKGAKNSPEVLKKRQCTLMHRGQMAYSLKPVLLN